MYWPNLQLLNSSLAFIHGTGSIKSIFEQWKKVSERSMHTGASSLRITGECLQGASHWPVAVTILPFLPPFFSPSLPPPPPSLLPPSSPSIFLSLPLLALLELHTCIYHDSRKLELLWFCQLGSCPQTPPTNYKGGAPSPNSWPSISRECLSVATWRPNPQTHTKQYFNLQVIA